MGSPASFAAIIASESYVTGPAADAANGIYEAAADIYGAANKSVKGGSIIGFGASDWVGNTGLIDANSTGLTSPGVDYAAGGSVKYAGFNDGTTRAVRRSLDTYTGNSTYYISMLLRSDIVETGGEAYGGFNATEDAFSNPSNAYGLFFGFAGNGTGMDLVLRQRQQTAPSTFELVNTVLAAAAADTTYQLVAKIDVNAFGSEEGVTIWLNPTDESSTPVATFGAGGNVYSMPNETSISVMSVSAQTFTGGVSFDEMRLATQWSDVAIPEPSSIALLGAGVLVVLSLRKYRRR